MTEKKVNELLKYWEAYYRSRGMPDEFTKSCLEYAKKFFQCGLPVIFDRQHLCLLLGLDEQYINSVVYGADCHYRTFYIRKKSGGVRELSAPHYTLKYVQNWIYQNILKNIKVNYCAHGFRPKKSILTNAKVHVKNRSLLKVDMKDFFPSIDINKVVNVFRSMGYSNHVSFYLASICCVNGHLPQGAPTSPALSNIIARHMDNRILGLCKKMNYCYTRYADDIAISGDRIDSSFVDYVKKIIVECGFEVNESKVKLYNGNGAKILTGVSMANNRIRLPRDNRRSLQMELYCIRHYGLYDHMRRRKIKDPGYLASLLGKLNYWLMLEPENAFAKQHYRELSQLYRQSI